MVTLTLIAAAVISLLLSRRLTGDYFTPASIVVATWAGGVGLCLLYLIPYEPLQPDTLRYIASIVVVLVAASAAGARWSRPASAGGTPAAPPSRAWVTAYSIAGLAGVGWYAASVVAILGWRGFVDGERLRTALTTYEIPSTFLVLQFFCLAAPLLAAALHLAGRPIGVRHAILPGLCALATLITTDRTQFFSLLLGLFFMYALALGPRLSSWRLLAGGTLVPLLLIGNFVAVDAWRRNILEVFEVKLRIEEATSRSTPIRAAAWRRATSAYFYLTCSFPALDALLRDPGPRTFGAYSAFPVTRLLQRAHVIEGGPPPYIPPFVRVTTSAADPPASSNAYTFVYYPLRDFGRWGALAYAALIGWASGYVYATVRRQRSSPLALLVAAQVSVGVAFLSFVNKFNNTAWWYVLILTLVPFAAGRVLRRGTRVSP